MWDLFVGAVIFVISSNMVAIFAVIPIENFKSLISLILNAWTHFPICIREIEIQSRGRRECFDYIIWPDLKSL